MNRFSFAAGLVLLALGAGLQGQSGVMTANIPFEFQMGTVQMPAGEYTIHYNQGLATLRQYPNSAKMALTTPVSLSRTPEQGRLVFHRYGDVYFLATIWTPFSTAGGAFQETSREKELARRDGAGQTTAVLLSSK